MNAAVYELPSMAAETAAHLNLIASRLRRGGVHFAGGAWRFSLVPVSGRPPWPSDPLLVTLEWGGGRLHLVGGRAALKLLYRHRFPTASLDVLPQDFALAGLQLAWRDAMAQIEALTGRRVRLAHAARPVAGALAGATYRFVLSLDSDSARDGLTAVLVADAPALGLLAQLARRLPLESPAPDPQTPLALRLELAETRLAIGTLRALAVHDVLVPDTMIEAGSPKVWLRADGRHAARARLEGHSLIIESTVEKKTTPVPQVSPDSAATDAPAQLDEVEVRLSFDLGEKVLTLAELAALKPGQVLELDAPLERLVRIRVNGRLIGRGELVRVADQVGVRILELASTGERQ